MSDLIFYTNGEETSRIPFPTPGIKCPETKLEIKMTETDISKVLIEGDYATIMGVKYKRVEEPKSPVEEAYKDWCGEYPTGGPSEDVKWGAFLAGYWVTQPKAVPVDEPEHYDEVEWDEKDNSKPMDEVVNRLVKKYEAQKLYNILKDRWCFSKDACEEIVEAVAEWLPEPQSAAGSQNVNTELLVDGFNHCLQKIKEMLR
jgi:hypothetical protein